MENINDDNNILKSNEFIMECFNMLLGKPENNKALKKQKILAEYLLSNMDKFEMTNINKNLVKLLRIVCTSHKQYESEPGNILFDDFSISQDLISEFKNEILNITSYVQEDEIERLRLEGFIKLAKSKLSGITIKNKIEDMVMDLSKIISEDSTDDILEKYEKIIQKEYIAIIDDYKRSNADENEIIISTGNDKNEKEIVDEITHLSELSRNKKKVSSGYEVMDSTLGSGFEAGRVYIFGGKPGLGKSALLLNFLVNYGSAISKLKRDRNKNKAIVYITLENDMVETSERLIRITTKYQYSLKSISNDEIINISSALMSKFTKVIYIKYLYPYTTSTTDLFMYLDKVNQEYEIDAIYVDYLNLISSSEKTIKNKKLEKRHELGMVTAESKVISKRFGCPIIIPTQLNTSGYDTIPPTMKNIDESRQVAQNADFVGLLFEVPSNIIPPDILYKYANGKIIGINIDKNRDGRKDIVFYNFNQNIYRFEELDQVSIKKLKTIVLQQAYPNKQNGNNQNQYQNNNQRKQYIPNNQQQLPHQEHLNDSDFFSQSTKMINSYSK